MENDEDIQHKKLPQDGINSVLLSARLSRKPKESGGGEETSENQDIKDSKRVDSINSPEPFLFINQLKDSDDRFLNPQTPSISKFANSKDRKKQFDLQA